MRKFLVRLFNYLFAPERGMVIQITLRPRNTEELEQVEKRLQRLRKLHGKYGLPATNAGIVGNAMRIYEHIILEEVEKEKPFFQEDGGDLIPVKFFLVDLE